MNFFKPNIKKMTGKKNVPGLVEAAEWGLRHRDIQIILGAITALGDIRDPHATHPLLQMAEECYFYFPEQCHPITAVIFRAIGKIGALQSYIPLVRVFSHFQTRPSTYIPNQLDDERYAAYIFALHSINQNEDRNLVDVLFQEILQSKKLISEQGEDEANSDKTRIAALDVLSIIGDEEDIIRLEE